MQILRPSSLPPQPPVPDPTPVAPPSPAPAMAELQQAVRAGNSIPPRPLPTPGGLPMPGSAPPAPAHEDALPAHTPSAPRAAARPGALPTPGPRPPVTASQFAAAPRTPRDELIELHQKLTPRRVFDVVGLTPAAPPSEVLAALANIRARAKNLQQTRAVDAATASAVIAKVQEIEHFIQDPVEHYVLTRGIAENIDTTANREAHRRFEIAFLDTMMPKVVWRTTGDVAGDPRFAQRFPVVAEATVEAPGVTARVPTDELTDSGLVLIGCPIAIQTDIRVFLHMQGGAPVPVRCSVESTTGERTKVVFGDVNDQTKAQIKEAIRQYDIAAMRQAERYQMLVPESPIALACLGLSRFLIATQPTERAEARKALAVLEAKHPDHPEVQLAVARAAVDSKDTAEAQRVLRLAKISAIGDRRVEVLVDQVGGDFAVLGATVGRATRTTLKVAVGVGSAAAAIAVLFLLQPAEAPSALEGVRCASSSVSGASFICYLEKGEHAPEAAEFTLLAKAKLLEFRPRGVRRVIVYNADGQLVASHPPASDDVAPAGGTQAAAVDSLLTPLPEPTEPEPPPEEPLVYVVVPGQPPPHLVNELVDGDPLPAQADAPDERLSPSALQVSEPPAKKPPKRKPQRKRR
jgi:hypothetical protein